jgi:hypothetical protein
MQAGGVLVTFCSKKFARDAGVFILQYVVHQINQSSLTILACDLVPLQQEAILATNRFASQQRDRFGLFSPVLTFISLKPTALGHLA